MKPEDDSTRISSILPGVLVTTLLAVVSFSVAAMMWLGKMSQPADMPHPMILPAMAGAAGLIFLGLTINALKVPSAGKRVKSPSAAPAANSAPAPAPAPAMEAAKGDETVEIQSDPPAPSQPPSPVEESAPSTPAAPVYPAKPPAPQVVQHHFSEPPVRDLSEKGDTAPVPLTSKPDGGK